MLHAVKEENKCFKLQFTYTKEIEIPSKAITSKQLTLLIGKKIGIVNYEDNYKIRVIKNKKSQ